MTTYKVTLRDGSTKIVTENPYAMKTYYINLYAYPSWVVKVHASTKAIAKRKAVPAMKRIIGRNLGPNHMVIRNEYES